MSRTNCPNCGAVIDICARKCAYCDTPYEWAIPIESQTKDQKYINKETEPYNYTVNMDWELMSKTVESMGISVEKATKALNRLSVIL